jgi:hypothetical protein
MTYNPNGSGLYGEQRELANSLRADRQHLEAAPLTPNQRKQLQKRIAETETNIKAVRAKIRDLKK